MENLQSVKLILINLCNYHSIFPDEKHEPVEIAKMFHQPSRKRKLIHEKLSCSLKKNFFSLRTVSQTRAGRNSIL